jgi:crotonobetainyl-CoA:carnitine CoA-transferase CaiB-like acyl-CoA transferase
MSGALTGFRVLDFGQYVAGPLAAMLLCEQGAEVIRIDPPGGPRDPSVAGAIFNRGKKSMVLDLKSEADKHVALRLVDTADLLIENFRPGKFAALGLGYKALAQRNPRLVYCSMPGFAHDDPRAPLAGWEAIIAAATDTYRPSPGSNTSTPRFWNLPVASNFAAMLAATACVNALNAQQRDGLGQHIEVALFDAMFTAIGARGMQMPTAVDMSLDFTGFGVYECQDGRHVHFAPVAPRFMDWFIAAAGVAQWATEGLLDRAALSTCPETALHLRSKLTGLFKTRTALAWETLADKAGVPLTVCRTTGEWSDTEHALTSQSVVSINDFQFGTMKQPGIPVRLSVSKEQIQGPRHQLNADQASIVADLLRPNKRVSRGTKFKVGQPCADPALKEVRVLDLTQVWAGPTAARALAEFGADVIKINNPHEPIMSHYDVNRGKRSILLDFTDSKDMEIFLQLVKSADVVMQNFRHGVAERLGIGYQDLIKIKPQIIYASVSAFGYDGPWCDRRGYEVQAQAAVGAQIDFGWPDQPARLPYEINDYGTGVLTAFGLSLALLHHARTGQGQQVNGALGYTATLHQSLRFAQMAQPHHDPSAFANTLGLHALYRLYKARDQWFFFALERASLLRLQQVLEQPLLGTLSDADQQDLLAHTFGEQALDYWINKLRACDPVIHRLVPVHELMSDPWVVGHGLSLTREHKNIGMIRTIGPVARLSRTPLVAGHPAPPPGSDRAAVMQALAAR